MRKSFGAKAICYPMPVFIIGTYNADGTPNAMNAAWGGISEETEITICVDSGHKTAENLVTRKAFTVSMATANYVAACDYVGLVSGNKEPDKFAKAGFHATKSEYVDAPLIDELPMALECEVISYDPETCRLVGRIVNVSADESVLGQNGKVDVGKLRPITYNGPQEMDHIFQINREHGKIDQRKRKESILCHEGNTQRNLRPRSFWRYSRESGSWEPLLRRTT